MVNAIQLYVTVDHQVIMAWAQRREARPSTFMGAERPWPLVFDLGTPDTGLKEIEWDDFFADFERAYLAFLFHETAENGDLDDLYEFANRSIFPELTVSRRSTIVRRAA